MREVASAPSSGAASQSRHDICGINISYSDTKGLVTKSDGVTPCGGLPKFGLFFYPNPLDSSSFELNSSLPVPLRVKRDYSLFQKHGSEVTSTVHSCNQGLLILLSK